MSRLNNVQIQCLLDKAGIPSLAEVGAYSFAEWRKKAQHQLSWHDIRALWQAARRERKENTLYESRLLSRMTPLLKNALRLETAVPSVEQQSYDSEFGQRSSQYAAPGAVSSMFSPAAYLTELYREARDLHQEESDWHLDRRRADLGTLALSQNNLDEELSTLALSNELLTEKIKLQDQLNSIQAVMEQLSRFRPQGQLPYHDAHHSLHTSLRLQNQEPGLFSSAPQIHGLITDETLLALYSAVSPELYAILTQVIPEGNEEGDSDALQQLWQANFGLTSPASLLDAESFARYYSLSAEEAALFFDQQNQYIKDSNLCVIDSAEGRKLYRIIRSGMDDNYRNNLNYIDIFAIDNNGWQIAFSTRADHQEGKFIHLDANGSGDHQYPWYFSSPVYKNTHYHSGRVSMTIPADGVINLECVLSNADGINIYTHVNFTPSELTLLQQQAILLRLNKQVLFYKTSMLPPQAMVGAALSLSATPDISAAVLPELAQIKTLMQRYTLSDEDALVLANADIAQYNAPGQISLFDRLFNTPPLNDQRFWTTAGTLNLNPDSTDNPWEKAVLKRAFQVDDVSLFLLLKVVDPHTTGTVNNNLSTLSDLYRASLLARVHQLDIDELAILLQAIGKRTGLAAMDNNSLTALVNQLYQVTRWLQQQAWTVHHLWVMTTSIYDSTLTPEIQNLFTTLINGLQDLQAGDTVSLIDAMAPYIAAVLQLPSSEVAHSLLTWADKLKPGTLDVMAFWTALQKPDPSTQCIQFSHGLAQLVIIYRTLALNDSALTLFVNHPKKLHTAAAEILQHDVATLQQLSGFTHCLNTAGTQASTLLQALSDATLNNAILASTLTLDETRLAGASAMAAHHNQVATENNYTAWSDIDSVLQWLQVYDAFHIAPQVLSRLLSLKVVVAPYSAWDSLASACAAGLDTSKAGTWQESQDEARSSALCAYVIQSMLTGTHIQNREGLYRYLLMDNQISAQISTTRIAEAIASLQLYVNQALEGMEPDVQMNVRARPFFTDWEHYNKRYSTWAGVSLLVYYPENYIDPTLRLGQTTMMDSLLQSISQSQLSEDSVGDAFKAYLTAFEQIANLRIVSAYHDEFIAAEGLTWFIGHRPQDTSSYYWRSVDHHKWQQGQFAANAWSEWKKIDCAISPYHALIRPVIWQSRLHILWLERKETATQNADGTVTNSENFELKLAYLRYDGNWSAPVSWNVDDCLKKEVISPASDTDLQEDSPFPVPDATLGLYCTCKTTSNALVVLFYQKGADDNGNKNTVTRGVHLYASMRKETLTVDEITTYRQAVYIQFDTWNAALLTEKVKKVNLRYLVGYDVPASVARTNYVGGDYFITTLYNGKIDPVSYTTEDGDEDIPLTLQIKPQFAIVHNGNDVIWMRRQCDLIKRFGTPGQYFMV